MTALKEAIDKLEKRNVALSEPSAPDTSKYTYFEIPEGIAQMSDEEIGEWSKEVYRQFVSPTRANLTADEKGEKE